MKVLLVGSGRVPPRAALFATTAAAAVLLAGGAAFAQAASDSPIALDEISVEGTGASIGFGGATADQGFAPNSAITGAKTDTPINEIPQIVNVITREELDKRGVEDFNQALAYTPAVRVTDYAGGQGAPTIYLRGFQTINQEGLYQDGLRAGFNGFDERFETFPYERIDILKGPASVLYGRAEPGGIVSLTTRRPTATPFGEIELQGGSHDRLQGTVDVGGPIDAEGNFLYRISGLLRDADTQVDFSKNDARYIAPAFTWKPTDSTSLTVLASHSWSKNGGSEQSLPASVTLGSNANGRIDRGLFLGEPDFNREELTSTQVGGILDHAFSDQLSFHSNTRAEWTKSKYDTMLATDGGVLYDRQIDANGDLSCPAAADLDPGTFELTPNTDGILGNERCYSRLPQRRRQDSRAFLTDNNFVLKADTGPLSHKVLVGVDYWNYDRDERRQNGALSGIDVFDPDYGSAVGPFNRAFDTDAKLEQTGLYAQDQIKLQRWILTLGIRHDWSKVDSKTSFYIPGTDTVGLVRAVDSNDKKFTYRAGLGYEFENGLTPYASYSTSFNPSPIAQANGDPFDPSEAKQYEAGIKYQPKGYDGYVAAAVFDITKTNLPTPVGNGQFRETGEVKVKGFEVESKVKLAIGLDVLAAYSYLDTEVTKDNAGLEGNRLQNVPKHQASLWLDYAMQPGSALEGLRFGAGVRYLGSTLDTSNTLRVRDYALFDASASYALGKLDDKLKGVTVKLEAQNIGDKRYYTPGFYPDAVFEGYRRQVLASVSYRW